VVRQRRDGRPSAYAKLSCSTERLEESVLPAPDQRSANNRVENGLATPGLIDRPPARKIHDIHV
jgi:hypothetical protein